MSEKLPLIGLEEKRLAELLVGDSDLTLNFSGRGSLQVLFRRRVI